MDDTLFSGLLESLRQDLSSGARKLPQRMRGDPQILCSLLLEAYKAICSGRGLPYLDNPMTSEALRMATAWLLGNGRSWLLLHGDVGSGKTTLAEAVKSVCDTLVRTRLSMRMPFDADCSDGMLQLVASARGFASRTAKDLAMLAEMDPEKYYALSTSPCLIIDDMGSESVTVKRYGTELTPVTEALFRRYESMLVTLITTNLSPEKIEKRYGRRLRDRMNEMCRVVRMDGRSFRK